MCEVLAQQLSIVLESAVAPPEKSIYTEVEMKNMIRVLQDCFVQVLRTSSQTQQLNRALHNQNAEHLKTLMLVELDQDRVARGKSQLQLSSR